MHVHVLRKVYSQMCALASIDTNENAQTSTCTGAQDTGLVVDCDTVQSSCLRIIPRTHTRYQMIVHVLLQPLPVSYLRLGCVET